MIETGQKFIFIFFFAALLILFCSSFSVVEGGLEIGYPTVPGIETPDEETRLPEYIKYIFNFSVIIVGILAFAVMVYGGIFYLISAGDPTKISDAKSRIFGGIVGLVLLLMTYLILTTINPELAILKEMEFLKPVNGIYLINGADEKKHIASDTLDIGDFQTEKILFIDSPMNLSSVFIFRYENMEAKIPGDIVEIENDEWHFENQIPIPIPATFPLLTFPKSISFLRNNFGVYLYEKTDFDLDLRPPLYLSGSTTNLGTWDNKTESLKIKHPSEEIIKMAFLFGKPDFTGNCGLVFELPPIPSRVTEIPNLSASLIIMGDEKPSSLHIFTVDSSEDSSGDVTFFDRENCDHSGNILKKTLESDAIMKVGSFNAEWAGRVRSFEINGPYVVVLATAGLGAPKDLQERDRICQLFQKKSDTACVDVIDPDRGSEVYSSDPDGVKPLSFFILLAR